MAAKKKNVIKKAAKGAKKAARKVAKKARRAQPIPKGFHTATPSLIVRGAADALEFYKNAFGAKELSRMADPSGKVMHAEIRIGDSIIMLGDEFPEMGARGPQSIGGTGSSVMLYTKDVDALFERAVKAGAKVLMPVANMFWGDRYGRVEDPFGHQWQLATHIEDLTPKEMAKRAQAAFSAPPGGGQG
ncbi:MAG: VOC family protein [Myxococcales bacterium]